ncbi:MAG: glycoside hydrolase, partial [Patescibacteria group bacterium]|nr:glycoside hydrolase [Patescibacteria group bacterium]
MTKALKISATPAEVKTITEITIDFTRPLFTLDDKYLSFAIDGSLAFGGHWWSPSGSVEWGMGKNKVLPLDVQNKKLIKLTAALAPAYLRIGGTEADKLIFNEPSSKDNTHQLTPSMWDKMNEFINKTGMKMFFTANAGPLVRNKQHEWQGSNFEKLLVYSKEKKYALDA